MRVLVLSDFHGQTNFFLRKFDEIKSKVEVIVICGDITHFGSAKQVADLFSSITSSNLPILYVPGNCDFPSLLEAKIEGVQNIHGTCMEINNIVFVGVGGSPLSSLHTPLEFSEDKIMAFLNSGLAKCPLSERLILVSHAPPHNTKLDLAFIGKHIGSKSVRHFIEEKKPIAVFCGHVHEARGVDKLDKTIILNPGPAMNGYYAVVDINNKVEIRFASFM